MDIDDSSSLSSISDHENAKSSRPATLSATPVAADASEPSAGNRRRSTRVVKKVQTYSPAPASMRKAKRKRAAAEEDDVEQNGESADKGGSTSPGTIQGDDDDNDGEDDEESAGAEESDESDGEPDEEELKERRRQTKKAARRGGTKRGRRGRPAGGATRKPAAKKAKTVTGEAAPALESRKKAAPKPRRKGKERDTNGDAVISPMVNNLYGAVFENEDDCDDVARGWIAKYQEDNADGMKEIINFILKCCGCDNEMTNYDIEDQDSASTTLTQIQDAFSNQQIAEYPLTSKKSSFRKFRQNLSNFIEALVAATVSENLVMTDKEMLENMQTWIGAMSSSTLRQFRHTSTVFALDMVSHFSASARELRRAVGTTNRQLEAERKKTSQNDARIEALSEKLKETELKREQIEDIIKDIFDTVFVHRYRDIDPKIRIDCIQELSNWISILPEIFFDGSYIRYLGWVLSDTVPATRLEVVKALTKLFKTKNQVSGLRHFTERFRERLVEMGTRDADTAVRAATVELLDVIREIGYLEPEDIETIGRLLFDSEQKVRRAVVPFFVENINDLYQEKLEELGGEEAVQEALGDEEEEEYGGPTLSWIKLKCLVEALASYDRAETGDDSPSQNLLAERSRGLVMKVDEIVSRFSLAGAVLWDALEEVRDWDGLARYLLYDHSASREGNEDSGDDEVENQVKKVVALDAKEDVILLQVLNASVAGSIIKGPDPPNKKKLQPEMEKHKESVSRSLMKLIPLLLKKFGPVPDAASSVLRLEQLMNLDIFQELRQSDAYSALLDEINRQFLTHADEGVLKEASAALRHAKTFEDLEEVTELKLGQLKDETVTSLGDVVYGKDLATAKFSDANLTELINTIRRLEHLSGITDCVEMLEAPLVGSSKEKSPELKPIDVLLELLKRGVATDELVEELTLRVLKVVDYYFMWKIAGLNAVGEGIEDIEFEDVITRRKTALKRIDSILEGRTEVDAVKITAASTLLDLATLFVSTSVLRISLAAGPLDKNIQAHLMAVFDMVEKSFAKGCGKKLEPDENAEPEDDEEETGEDAVDESTQLMLEQRLCEFTGKIILAVLSKAADQKTWRKRLARNQTQLGPNYKEVVNYLDRASVGRPGTRRAAPSKKAPLPPALPAQKKLKSAQKAADSGDENVEDDGEEEEGDEEEGEGEEGEEEGADRHEEDHEEDHEEHEEEHTGSEHSYELDLEAEAEIQDEEMVDV